MKYETSKGMYYIEEINNYWSAHSQAFSEVIQNEFKQAKRELWLQVLNANLPAQTALNILDVGCGPGFFTILLAEKGHLVTAIDYNPEMLAIAKRNSDNCGVSSGITFARMDAQALSFADCTFDVVVSRNLTWTLERPENAYREWIRVLKKGGKLINFDANWDTRLHNKYEANLYAKAMEELTVRGQQSASGESEENDRYMEIRKQLPLSKKRRPLWDFKTLLKLGCQSITVFPQIEGVLYDDYYERLYANTPTFMVSAVKKQRL